MTSKLPSLAQATATSRRSLRAPVSAAASSRITSDASNSFTGSAASLFAPNVFSAPARAPHVQTQLSSNTRVKFLQAHIPLDDMTLDATHLVLGFTSAIAVPLASPILPPTSLGPEIGRQQSGEDSLSLE